MFYSFSSHSLPFVYKLHLSHVISPDNHTWLPCREKRTRKTRITLAVNFKMSQQQYKLARFAKYGPPPMTQEDKVKQEKGFVLDAVAVSTLSDDSGRANPKMATAIPPYNAQKDRHSKGYFEKPVVRKLLTKTEQVIISFILNCGACLIIKWCRYAYNRCFIMFI